MILGVPILKHFRVPLVILVYSVLMSFIIAKCNSYNTACLTVQGNAPQALAFSGWITGYLPYRWTNHGITILYHLISVDLAQYEIQSTLIISNTEGLSEIL